MTDPSSSRPNLLIVFMDDMGYGDMGCFGSPSIRTPHMDAVAQRGARFTQMYASAAICTPSRAGLLTGRLAQRMGIERVLFPRDDHGLPAREKTLADYLRQAGYATVMAGKWHLGCRPEHNPVRHGFDHYLGLLYSNDMDPLHLYRNEQAIETEVDQAQLTRRYTDEIIEFIDGAGDRPFFAYLAHTMPHIPLHVEEDFRGRSAGGTYGDTIECIDHHLGRLLDHLDSRGKLDDTLVIVTSDNGPWYEGSTGGLRGRKFEVYEGGIRMPFVAQWPGVIEPASVIDAPASLLDLLPTCCALAGVTPDAQRELDGVDLSQALGGGEMPPREAIYFYRHNSLQAARVGDWKLHVAFGTDDRTAEMPQLFDLSRDWQECYNLADSHPDVVEHIKALMADFDPRVAADRESVP